MGKGSWLEALALFPFPLSPRTTMTGEPLPTLVRDLMTVGVATCAPDTPIAELAQLLVEKDLNEVIILEDGHALGVVGPEELVRAFSSPDYRSLVAEQLMREGVPQIPPDIPLAAAAQIMLDLKIRTLFLMHHAAGIEYPAASITYRHFLRYLAASDGDDLRDLGIKAERQPPLESFIQRRQAKRAQLKYMKE